MSSLLKGGLGRAALFSAERADKKPEESPTFCATLVPSGFRRLRAAIRYALRLHVARKSDDLARIEDKHQFVALEPGARATVTTRRIELQLVRA